MVADIERFKRGPVKSRVSAFPDVFSMANFRLKNYGCLQLLEILVILEISWNLKTLLEILEISWNLNGPPGNFCVMIENFCVMIDRIGIRS